MKNDSNLDKNISFRNSFVFSYKLLNKKERILLKQNIFISFIAGLFEIISVTTFYPLVSIIIDPNLKETNKFINKIWLYLGNPQDNKFVIFLSLIASLVLFFSVLLNLVSVLKSTRDASSAEERLSKEFYKDIIYSPYKWHILTNPNRTRNIILTNINIWNKGVIRIIPAMAGQLAGIIFAFLTVLIATPKLGLVLILISGSLLAFLLKFMRKRSNKLMQKVRKNQEIINIFLSESLSGIKDIKLSSAQNLLIN